MNSFKQALTYLIRHFKNSLILGVVSTFFFYLSRFIPYFGALILSIGFLIMRDQGWHQIQKQNWDRNLDHVRHHFISYLATSLILFPTFILLGSALGVLESPQNILTSLLFSVGLLTVSVYFYFILSHSLQFHLKSKTPLTKAIDKIGLRSLKSMNRYTSASLMIGILLAVSDLFWGVGFLLTLPVMFFTDYFIYQELSQQQEFRR